jgi:flavin-dependent dehydrogenase
VQFFSTGGAGRPFYFSETKDPRTHSTWQVLRSDFDAMLVRNAEAAGVSVRTRSEVVRVCERDGVVNGVELKGANGVERIDARVVVDASGQQSMLARKFGARENIEGLQNVAVYAHYRNAVRDEGIDAGSTLIYRLEHGAWLWFIPLPEVVSIGLVAPFEGLSAFGKAPAEILDNAIASCEFLRPRLVDAERSNEARAIRDFSYRATVDGGKGWVLVGDALSFIDPMYSTGLFLTMYSAELAAEAIVTKLKNEATPDFRSYSGKYQEAYEQFLWLVRAFYREDFHFGQLAKDPVHRQGLIDLLTGIVGTPEAGRHRMHARSRMRRSRQNRWSRRQPRCSSRRAPVSVSWRGRS